jgi:ADP-ribose pyrophosphatase
MLIRQYRYAAEQYLYECLRAGSEERTADDCARRELREETGCEAERVEHLVTIYTTPASPMRVHSSWRWASGVARLLRGRRVHRGGDDAVVASAEPG